MRDGETFFFGAGVAAVLGLLPVMYLCGLSHKAGEEKIQAQAIVHGLAEYKVDQKTQAVTFRWKTQPLEAK